MSKNRAWYPRCKKTNKVRYPNYTVARRVMFIFMKTGKPDPGIHEYYCNHCLGVHLGSSTRSLERAMRGLDANST